MRSYVFLAPDTSPDAVAKALSQSLAPKDAEVRIDALMGLVSVTTPGPWRADKQGLEDGLGVPGWGLLSAETVEQTKAPELALAEAKIVLEKSAPVVLPDVAAEAVVIDVIAKR